MFLTKKRNSAITFCGYAGALCSKWGKHAEAMTVLADLVKKYPDSLRAKEGKMLWANSAASAGQIAAIPNFLLDLNEKNDAAALLATAKSFEAQGNQAQAVKFYRQVYFYAAGTDAAKEAETKLTALGQTLSPQTTDEVLKRGDALYKAKKYSEARTAYDNLATNFPNATAQIH
jgi:TolA-binding protein